MVPIKSKEKEQPDPPNNPGGSNGGGEKNPEPGKPAPSKPAPSKPAPSKPAPPRPGSGNKGAAYNLKLVLVGDTAVGKSCLITNYLHNMFDEKYKPTVLDVYEGEKELLKKTVKLEIHDTSGDEHLGANRKMQYKGADVFMICVACNARKSFDNIETWRTEIQAVETTKPIILILTKKDLEGLVEDPVTEEELVEYKEEERYQDAYATSSKEWQDWNVHDAFNKTLAFAYTSKYNM